MSDRGEASGAAALGSPHEQLALIYSTFPDAATARAVGTELVASRLVACVNILGPITSLYLWNGNLETSSEVAVVLKTTRARLAEALDAAERLHPYDVPALIVIEPAATNPAYLAWAAAGVVPDAALPAGSLDSAGKGQ